MSPFIGRKGPFARLGGSDLRYLDEVLRRHVKKFKAGQLIAEEGTSPDVVHVTLSGWACPYKRLRGGRRQVLAFILPHDVSDLELLPAARIDYEMSCLTSVESAALPRQTFEKFFGGEHPAIAHRFREKAILTASIQRTWMVNLGCRSAPERIAHLLCETYYRLMAYGMTNGNQFILPVTQQTMADAIGLSLVHVNKRLSDFRRAGLVSLQGKLVTVHDLPGLEDAACFSAEYLDVNDRESS